MTEVSQDALLCNCPLSLFDMLIIVNNQYIINMQIDHRLQVAQIKNMD